MQVEETTSEQGSEEWGRAEAEWTVCQTRQQCVGAEGPLGEHGAIRMRGRNRSEGLTRWGPTCRAEEPGFGSREPCMVCEHRAGLCISEEDRLGEKGRGT